MSEKLKTAAKTPETKIANAVSRKPETVSSSSANSPVERILSLHRTIGNQAVQRLFKSGAIQAKLKVGQPNDIYEQEANRVADAVMRMPVSGIQQKPAWNSADSPSSSDKDFEEDVLQAEALCNQISPIIQRQNGSPEEEETFQPERGSGQSLDVSSDVESKIKSLKDNGHPLPESVRSYFEPRFGMDFTQVRVHTDEKAAEMCRVLNAKAFTKGQEVVFGAGQYEPTTSGKRLLAHELAHVVQQSSRKTLYRKADTARQKKKIRLKRKKTIPLRAYPFLQKVLNEKEKSDLIKPLTIRTQIRQIQTEMEQFAKEEEINIEPPYGGGVSGVLKKMDKYHERIRRLRNIPVPKDLLLHAIRLCHTDIFPNPSEPNHLKSAKKRIIAMLKKIKATIYVVDPYATKNIDNSIRIVLGKYDVSKIRRGVHFKDLLNISKFKVIVLEEKQKEETIKQRVKEVSPLLEKLKRLGKKAKKEGTSGANFKKAIDVFRKTLKNRVDAAKADQPLPPDIQLVMKALILWSKDPGNQWGEGTWDSKDLIMSAPDYATVPASQYKCNAYVAEVIYQAVNVVHRAYKSEEQKGKYFPYRAQEWGNSKKTIPHFVVVSKPQIGDIWSIGSHIGIYLGKYAGKGLYISARDDGSGVFSLEKEQKKHGIQIKYVKSGGVYRRYKK